MKLRSRHPLGWLRPITALLAIALGLPGCEPAKPTDLGEILYKVPDPPPGSKPVETPNLGPGALPNRLSPK